MPLHGSRILVVEDDPLVSAIIADSLTDAGARVVGPFSSVTEALDGLDELAAIDAAILDVGLSDETSYPLATALQSTRIPFIFVTGVGRADLQSGFTRSCYLQKPFKSQELVEALADLL